MQLSIKTRSIQIKLVYYSLIYLYSFYLNSFRSYTLTLLILLYQFSSYSEQSKYELQDDIIKVIQTPQITPVKVLHKMITYIILLLFKTIIDANLIFIIIIINLLSNYLKNSYIYLEKRKCIIKKYFNEKYGP